MKSMPTSRYNHVVPVLNCITKHIQRDTDIRILDIGVGFGKYGFLLREWFDIRKNRYPKKEWRNTIHGVDIWKPYITPAHRYIYDGFYIGDICDVVDGIKENYDVILTLEILEHIDKERGRELVKKIVSFTNELCIFSFPRTLNPRANNEWENPYERHVSLWTVDELQSLIGKVQVLSPTIFAKVVK